MMPDAIAIHKAQERRDLEEVKRLLGNVPEFPSYLKPVSSIPSHAISH